MALLLFIRSFPVRAVVFFEREFPKGGFGRARRSGSKKQIFEMKKNKSREKRSGRRGSEYEY
jgi:hypothetical protein